MPTWPKIRPWLFSITLIFAFGLAGFFWLKMKMTQLDTSHAIYVTGTLVDAYHVYWREHGTWPPEGSILARDVVFVRSVRNGANSRTDVFNFGGGVFACLSLSSNGKITALPSRAEPTTRP
jgi:hypothetical protein